MLADEPVDAPVDPWALAGLPGGLTLASYLTASPETVSQYRLIVDTLLDQQDQSLTGIAHDDLAHQLHIRLAHAATPATATRLLADLNLKSRMTQLLLWGVIDTWDERPVRDEDFLRNSNRYQLTPLAAQLHRAVRRLGDDDTDRSVAATFAPQVLRAQLDLMVASLDTNPETVAAAWSVITSTLEAMAQAAAGWQARLAGALAGAPDATKVTTLQETLRRYVDMWGAGVDTHSATIATNAAALRTADRESWRIVALYIAGADARDDDIDTHLNRYDQTLATVEGWFSGPTSQARRLRTQMRDAIAPMVRGQRTLAAVGGHVSRRAELLSLAGALQAAPDDTTAWDLWCTATGLFSTRHLGTASPQPAPGATVSFWDAAPAPVEARLRRHGARALTGRPARIADRSAGKAAARAAAAAANRRTLVTHAAIQARSGQLLSQWSDITDDETDTLLLLLATLASAGPVSQPRSTRTGDGHWHLRAEPVPPGTPPAVIHTPRGRLVHPDLRLTITTSRQP